MNRRSTRAVTAALAGAAALLVVLSTTGIATADPNPNAPGTPPSGTAEQIYAGVGADAFAELTNNVATSFNTQRPAPTHTLASYDAVDPGNQAAGGQITTKPDCSLVRPNGANAGITTIINDPQRSDGLYCVDFVRSSRGRGTASGEANLTFFAQSRDAVSYATVGNAYAPVAPLSTPQLKSIFQCRVSDWSEVGGQPGPIHLYLPPASAATYTFFLSAIGLVVGDVSTGCQGSATNTFNSRVYLAQQNDGRTLAGDPQGIAPYAVTKWAAQDNEPAGIADLRGGAQIGLVNTTQSPFTTSTVGGTTYKVLDPAFVTSGTGSPSFGRYFFNVTRNSAPQDLKNIFNANGYLCQHAAELLIPYGNTPLGTDTTQTYYCGSPN